MSNSLTSAISSHEPLDRKDLQVIRSIGLEKRSSTRRKDLCSNRTIHMLIQSNLEKTNNVFYVISNYIYIHTCTNAHTQEGWRQRSRQHEERLAFICGYEH